MEDARTKLFGSVPGMAMTELKKIYVFNTMSAEALIQGSPEVMAALYAAYPRLFDVFRAIRSNAFKGPISIGVQEMTLHQNGASMKLAIWPVFDTFMRPLIRMEVNSDGSWSMTVSTEMM